MLALTLLLNIAFEPGEFIETIYYNTSTCTHPTPANTDGVCFSVFGQHPASFCRKVEPNCTETGQKIVSALSFSHFGPCTRYAWSWACAYEKRSHCGNFWCDNRSICVDGMYCECPNNMIGDPAWQGCVCPRTQYATSSDTCVDLPNCSSLSPTLSPTRQPTFSPFLNSELIWDDDPEEDNWRSILEDLGPTTAPTSCNCTQTANSKSNEESDFTVGIAILVVFAAILLGVLGGVWCGHFYFNETSSVAPVSPPSESAVHTIQPRHQQNLMYVSADPVVEPVYHYASSPSSTSHSDH